jgi:flagellar hook-basal body complex protein FliE
MIVPVSAALNPVTAPGSGVSNSLSVQNPPQNQPSFADLLGKALDEVNNLEMDANHKAERMAAGLEPDIHTVMIAAEKADLAFQLTVQVRNKVLEAYQDLMRMQV